MTDAPELIVRLETDDNGRPAIVAGKTGRQFGVVFEVKNPPHDTYAATFELDPTGYDAVRTLPANGEGTFRVVSTTQGDFPLVVRLRTRQGREIVLKETLAKALRRSRPSGPADPAYAEALDYIAAH